MYFMCICIHVYTNYNVQLVHLHAICSVNACAYIFYCYFPPLFRFEKEDSGTRSQWSGWPPSKYWLNWPLWFFRCHCKACAGGWCQYFWLWDVYLTLRYVCIHEYLFYVHIIFMYIRRLTVYLEFQVWIGTSMILL